MNNYLTITKDWELAMEKAIVAWLEYHLPPDILRTAWLDRVEEEDWKAAALLASALARSGM